MLIAMLHNAKTKVNCNFLKNSYFHFRESQEVPIKVQYLHGTDYTFKIKLNSSRYRPDNLPKASTVPPKTLVN